MQSTQFLKPENVKPRKGMLFGEAILGRYETESGIIVVQHLKRNPPISKIKVISTGAPFERFKNRKRIPGIYWAAPGETAFMKRATATIGVTVIQGKTYCFIHNDDIVGAA